MLLYDLLKQYSASGIYPFHMPGHKRRMGLPEEACALDITEVEGFDDLHHAESVLKEAQERAARLYGAEDTYYLVNGSTAGILAAVCACVPEGGRLLLSRNSHRSVYHAIEIRGIDAVYLYPKQSGKDGRGVSFPFCAAEPADVRRGLKNTQGIDAVFLTSPTYEGAVSDVREIARIAHSFGVPLIVDEAHGAHFGFHPDFPQSSVKLGADLVVHSLHKTLPSMTQTALLHRNGNLVSDSRVRKFLSVYQTSSPSYVLMASIDACVALLEKDGKRLFEAFSGRLKQFVRQTQGLQRIHLMRASFQDPSKLVLFADGMSGVQLAETLRRRFGLELEMGAGDYAVALTSIADTDEGFSRLARALQELDGELQKTDGRKETAGVDYALANEAVMTIAQADNLPQKTIFLAESAGEISAQYLYVYPPGIPMLVPGERIGKELLRRIQACRALGLVLRGADDLPERIHVIDRRMADA